MLFESKQAPFCIGRTLLPTSGKAVGLTLWSPVEFRIFENTAESAASNPAETADENTLSILNTASDTAHWIVLCIDMQKPTSHCSFHQTAFQPQEKPLLFHVDLCCYECAHLQDCYCTSTTQWPGEMHLSSCFLCMHQCQPLWRLRGIVYICIRCHEARFLFGSDVTGSPLIQTNGFASHNPTK